jgi:hypothetical protein
MKRPLRQATRADEKGVHQTQSSIACMPILWSLSLKNVETGHKKRRQAVIKRHFRKKNWEMGKNFWPFPKTIPTFAVPKSG